MNLRRIDDIEGVKFDLPNGKTTIGRGPVLKCADKKISRNHAILEVSQSDQKITLKSTHINPCFYQPSGKGQFEPVLRDEVKILKHGDRFSLLPMEYIYEVDAKSALTSVSIDQSDATDIELEKSKSSYEDQSDHKKTTVEVQKKTVPAETSNRRRDLPKWLEDSVAKRKTGVTESPEHKPKNGRVKKLKVTPKKRIQTTNQEEINDRIENIVDKSEEQKVVEAKRNSDISESNLTGNKTSLSNALTVTKKRTPCSFGNKCYRKNPAHFSECSHPGDSDYAEEHDSKDEEKNDGSDDDRPECEFGVDCYRKNPQHQKQFRHTKRQRAVTKKAARTKLKMEDEDTDDSFVVDDDSDEYIPSGSDTEDDISGLINEAEKFKRNKKLMRPA